MLAYSSDTSQVSYSSQVLIRWCRARDEKEKNYLRKKKTIN